MRKKALIIGMIGVFLLIQPISAQMWTATKRLTWNFGDSYVPAIAVDSSNTIHVVWYDDTIYNWEIFYKRSTNGGADWSGSKRLTWTSGSSLRTAITTDSSNHIFVCWAEDSTIVFPNSEIFFKKGMQ